MSRLGIEYAPTEYDKRRADEAYTRYLAGIAMLRDPEGTQPIHGFSLEKVHTGIKPLVRYTGKLMVAGLKNVIRYAHPAEKRSSMAPLEFMFEAALPHMQATVDRIYDDHTERLEDFGPALVPAVVALRPAPMLDKTIYRHLCHGRMAKLSIERLLDDVAPSPILEPFAETMTLSEVRTAS